MKRQPLFCFLFPVLLLVSSCRKDLLHWQQAVQLNSGTTSRLNDMLYVSDTLVLACGGVRFLESTITVSRDGGHTWTAQSLSEAGKELFGLTLTPSGELYACGLDGKLLHSTDGGNHWQLHQFYRYDLYNRLVFFAPDNGVAVGGISFNIGNRLHFNAGGDIQQWDSLTYQLNDIALAAPGTAFASGYGIMQKTTDAGHTWQTLELKGDNFTAVDVHNSNEAYTCGYQGSIFRTSDGGRTWQRLRNGNDLTLPRYHLLDLLFTDEQHGYAVGEDGLIIYSDDGGQHWMEFDRFTHAHLRCVVARPDGDLMVCGDNGNIWQLRPKPL